MKLQAKTEDPDNERGTVFAWVNGFNFLKYIPIDFYHFPELSSMQVQNNQPYGDVEDLTYRNSQTQKKTQLFQLSSCKKDWKEMRMFTLSVF